MADEKKDEIEIVVEPAPVETATTTSATTTTAAKTEGAVEKVVEKPEPEYSARVAGRIGNLTRKFRESERQTEEAVKFAKGVLSENELLKKRLAETNQGFYTEAEKTAESQLEASQRALAVASAAGDTAAVVAATTELARAAAAKERASSAKAQAPKPEQVQSYQMPQQFTQQAGPSDRAVSWAQGNPWFGKDKALTALAYGVHQDLVDSGVDPESDDYYESLDARMKEYAPTKFQQKKAEATVTTVERRVTDPAASSVQPVNRTASGSPRQIRLTQTQVALAKRLGVPLEQYAREYAKLNSAEGN